MVSVGVVLMVGLGSVELGSVVSDAVVGMWELAFIGRKIGDAIGVTWTLHEKLDVAEYFEIEATSCKQGSKKRRNKNKKEAMGEQQPKSLWVYGVLDTTIGNTEQPPQGHINAVTLRSGKEFEDPPLKEAPKQDVEETIEPEKVIEAKATKKSHDISLEKLLVEGEAKDDMESLNYKKILYETSILEDPHFKKTVPTSAQAKRKEVDINYYDIDFNGGAKFKEKYEMLFRWGVVATKYCDIDALKTLRVKEDVRWLFDNIRLGNLLTTKTPISMRATLEFISFLKVHMFPNPSSGESSITFQLFNEDHTWTLEKFNEALGIPIGGPRVTPQHWNEKEIWQTIIPPRWFKKKDVTTLCRIHNAEDEIPSPEQMTLRNRANWSFNYSSTSVHVPLLPKPSTPAPPPPYDGDPSSPSPTTSSCASMPNSIYEIMANQRVIMAVQKVIKDELASISATLTSLGPWLQSQGFPHPSLLPP
ncbi:Myosin-14 [Bienertia sinuspersici]